MTTSRVFELRTYTANPGKLADLQSRFRDHTLRLFEKHGITNVAYLTPTDGERADDTLVYLLGHPDRATADTSWAAFQADPEWIEAKAQSESNGRLVANAESVFLSPTDYSPLA